MTKPMYVPYHMHTMLSNGVTNIDSITDFHDYIEAAKACGMPALGISEHGSIFHWVKKKEEIEKAGLKYLHCIEVYVTGDNDDISHIYSADELLLSTISKKNIRLTFKEYRISEDGKYFATPIGSDKEY